MSITFDATSKTTAGNTPTATLSHTTSGTNRILFAFYWINATGAVTATYNGIPMTRVGSQVGLNFTSSGMFVLVNPSSGTNNIVFTNSNTPSNAWVIAAASYNGAHQTGQPDNSASGGGNSPAITPVGAGCWAISYGFADQAAVSGSGTVRIGNASSFLVQDSNGIIPAGSSYTGLSFSGGTNPQSVIASFSPDTPPIVPSASFLFTMI